MTLVPEKITQCPKGIYSMLTSHIDSLYGIYMSLMPMEICIGRLYGKLTWSICTQIAKKKKKRSKRKSLLKIGEFVKLQRLTEEREAQKMRVHMNVVPRSTGNTLSLTLTFSSPRFTI